MQRHTPTVLDPTVGDSSPREVVQGLGRDQIIVRVLYVMFVLRLHSISGGA